MMVATHIRTRATMMPTGITLVAAGQMITVQVTTLLRS